MNTIVRTQFYKRWKCFTIPVNETNTNKKSKYELSPVLAVGGAAAAVASGGLIKLMMDKIAKDKKNEEIELLKEKISDKEQKKDRIIEQRDSILVELKALNEEIQTLEEDEKNHPLRKIDLNPESLIIVVLGIMGEGKSTVCNRIWGDDSEEGDKGPFKTGHTRERGTHFKHT